MFSHDLYVAREGKVISVQHLICGLAEGYSV